MANKPMPTHELVVNELGTTLPLVFPFSVREGQDPKRKADRLLALLVLKSIVARNIVSCSYRSSA